jgi:hypothetical protein
MIAYSFDVKIAKYCNSVMLILKSNEHCLKGNEEIVLEDWRKLISDPSIKLPYFVNKN